MRQPGRWLSQLVVVLGAVTACASPVAGAASPMLVIGVAQKASVDDGAIEVRPLVLLDPAPVYSSRLSGQPAEGTRLVAVRFKATNLGEHDELTSKQVHFYGDDGEDYLESFVETAAGPRFEQVMLAPGQSLIGYITAEIPEDVVVEAVDYEIGSLRDKTVLRWDVAAPPATTAPELPARSADAAEAKPLGTEVSITGNLDGPELGLRLAPTKIIDPAEPTEALRAGADRRLVGVEFAVSNTGASFNAEAAELCSIAVYNAADEAIQSHIDGFTSREGLPLAGGASDTWTVLFEVPTDFDVDRLSFGAVFGDDTTTLWAVT